MDDDSVRLQPVPKIDERFDIVGKELRIRRIPPESGETGRRQAVNLLRPPVRRLAGKVKTVEVSEYDSLPVEDDGRRGDDRAADKTVCFEIEDCVADGRSLLSVRIRVTGKGDSSAMRRALCFPLQELYPYSRKETRSMR